ncbi:MAG: hypothetical protein ACE5FF_07685 [Saprospiraceae bacterium]
MKTVEGMLAGAMRKIEVKGFPLVAGYGLGVSCESKMKPVTRTSWQNNYLFSNGKTFLPSILYF